MSPQTGAAATPLASWRDEFPILETTTYLISNSLGAMPRGTASSLAQYAQAWAQRGVRAWEEGWWDMPVAVGDMVGALIGAPRGSVTMHQNAQLQTFRDDEGRAGCGLDEQADVTDSARHGDRTRKVAFCGWLIDAFFIRGEPAGQRHMEEPRVEYVRIAPADQRRLPARHSGG